MPIHALGLCQLSPQVLLLSNWDLPGHHLSQVGLFLSSGDRTLLPRLL